MGVETSVKILRFSTTPCLPGHKDKKIVDRLTSSSEDELSFCSRPIKSAEPIIKMESVQQLSRDAVITRSGVNQNAQYSVFDKDHEVPVKERVGNRRCKFTIKLFVIEIVISNLLFSPLLGAHGFRSVCEKIERHFTKRT